MSMSAGPRQGGVSAEINVTPFADIMIVPRTQPGMRTTRNP